MININKNGEAIIIGLVGRVDSNNAEDVRQEIWDVLEQEKYNSIVIDMEELEYISSAGLRVILKLIKRGTDTKAINVSSEVYEILEMTGFTELLSVEKAFKKMNLDGCKAIGKGAKGTVYRYDAETVIKVYNDPDSLPDIKNERKMARIAFVLGIPTAISYDIVKVGDCYGSVFELLDAKSYSEKIAEEPENIEQYAKGFANLLKEIHSTDVDADVLFNEKKLVYKWLSETEQYFPEEVFNKLKKLVDETPNRATMIHGDYHTNNLMVQNGETLLIDMDTLAYGHPVFELANVYAGLVGLPSVDPINQEEFLGYPVEDMGKVWETFFPAYLGTDDKAKLDEVQKKVELIGDLRCLRHLARRIKSNNNYAEAVKYFSKRIAELIEEVSELDFK